MKYIIIGLGKYGGVLAEELTQLGHEVIGVDVNEDRVDLFKDKIATSFIIDATDEQSLEVLPLNAVDFVIVAIGKNFGSSVKVVAHLKKNKVKHIYARAEDNVHKAVLQAFNLESILCPERDAARNLVRQLDMHVHVESFRVDAEHYVVKFKIPTSLVGYSVNDLALKKVFKLKIISLVKARKALNAIGISMTEHQVENTFDVDYVLEADDILVCYGRYKDFISFWRSI